MSLQSQYNVAQDMTFIGRVTQALITTAIAVGSEATTLGAALKSGSVTTIPVSPNLGGAIAGNTVLAVGSEYVTAAAGGASSGAATIPLAASQTLASAHPSTEVVSPPTDARHAKRLSYAVLVLNSPAAYGPLVAQGVASQGLDNSATDTAISNSVSGLYNAYAGAAS